MHPVADVKAVVRNVAGEFLSVRNLLTGLIVLGVSSWVFSRVLPGAAARVGILPRPWSPKQIGWPEPFGLVPLNVYYKAMTTRGTPTAAASGGTATPISGADDVLNNIT